MPRAVISALILVAAFGPAAALAQGAAQPCAIPDSVAVSGISRIPKSTVIADAGLKPGDTLNYRVVQRAIKNLFATGNYDDIQVHCDVNPVSGKATLLVHLIERPLLASVTVTGAQVVSTSTVRGVIDLPVGRPVDPALVAHSRRARRFDLPREGLLPREGEGRLHRRGRAAQARLQRRRGAPARDHRRPVQGEQAGQDLHAHRGDARRRPKGTSSGRRASSTRTSSPPTSASGCVKVYREPGLHRLPGAADTIVVDATTGKGIIVVYLNEGPKYLVGTFEVVGNRHFSTEEIRAYYPFTGQGPSITQQLMSVVKGELPDPRAFNEETWDEATGPRAPALQQRGLHLRVGPPDRRPRAEHRHHAHGEPALGDRRAHPGDDQQDRHHGQRLHHRGVHPRAARDPAGRRVQPGPPAAQLPERPEHGLLRVAAAAAGHAAGERAGRRGHRLPREGEEDRHDQLRRLGGTGDGRRRLHRPRPAEPLRHLQAREPAVAVRPLQQRLPAHVHRPVVASHADLGVGLGVPHPHRSTSSPTSAGASGRAARSSSASRCAGRPSRGSSCRTARRRCSSPAASRWCDTNVNTNKNFRSTLGVSLTHDNRVDMPFASGGSLRTIGVQFNGGPLGGTATSSGSRARSGTTTRSRRSAAATPGSQPIKVVLGLTARTGFVFGNTGSFFYSQLFTMGGTQYGEMLRGYPSFSITPHGYSPGSTQQAQVASFGSSFFSMTGGDRPPLQFHGVRRPVLRRRERVRFAS